MVASQIWAADLFKDGSKCHVILWVFTKHYCDINVWISNLHMSFDTFCFVFFSLFFQLKYWKNAWIYISKLCCNLQIIFKTCIVLVLKSIIDQRRVHIEANVFFFLGKNGSLYFQSIGPKKISTIISNKILANLSR